MAFPIAPCSALLRMLDPRGSLFRVKLSRRILTDAPQMLVLPTEPFLAILGPLVAVVGTEDPHP